MQHTSPAGNAALRDLYNEYEALRASMITAHYEVLNKPVQTGAGISQMIELQGALCNSHYVEKFQRMLQRLTDEVNKSNREQQLKTI